MNSIEEIKQHYELRKSEFYQKWNEKNYLFYQFAAFYRELLYYKILKKRFKSFEHLKLLEIGAGSGYNLYFFNKIGFSLENMYANELMEDRLAQLRKNFPTITIFEGNALDIDTFFHQQFDVLFQSTVFSSIPDAQLRTDIAQKMLKLLKDDGIILWYDFFVYNPYNKHTIAIRKNEIKKLFKNARKISFHKTTLASPIARRVGRLYPFFNLFPFLKTHYVCVIEK